MGLVAYKMTCEILLRNPLLLNSTFFLLLIISSANRGLIGRSTIDLSDPKAILVTPLEQLQLFVVVFLEHHLLVTLLNV